jgi:osmotically-inducible protein OsmY
MCTYFRRFVAQRVLPCYTISGQTGGLRLASFSIAAMLAQQKIDILTAPVPPEITPTVTEEDRQSMQTAATEFADVFKFRFDAKVEASDGDAGRLVRVIANGQQRVVTHIGVQVGLLFGKMYYLPLDLVSTATADVITVNVPLEEMVKSTIKPDGAELSRSTGIMVAGKRIGQLNQLTIHKETRRLRHLVIDRGSRELVVPATAVTSLAARQISADLGGASVSQLTVYRPDEELRQAVYDAIYDYPRLRVELNGIIIHAIDGVVWLRGYVSNDLNRRMVEDQLQDIPGLAELHNDLITDTGLAADVAMALAHDPRTAYEHIGVYPKLGEVHLRGRVTTSEARAAAGAIASSNSSVKEVVNELLIDPSAEVVPVLAGITNEEDKIPGSQ